MRQQNSLKVLSFALLGGGIALAITNFGHFSLRAAAEAPQEEVKAVASDFMIVDLMQIITEALVSQDIQKQLAKTSEEYQKEFAVQDQKFRAENEKLVASQSAIKPDVLQQKQMDLQKRFESFQQKIDMRRRQLELAYRNAMGQVQKKVDDIVDRLANQKKLSRIYREAAFAWVRDLKKVDMTPEVLAILNKETPQMPIKIPTEKEVLSLVGGQGLTPPPATAPAAK